MPNVLVIDDNPAVATALETLVSLHDISTRSVTSPDDGLALRAALRARRKIGAQRPLAH